MIEPPVIECRYTEHGTSCVEFWCRFCHSKHVHGAVSLGHRVAHCHSEEGRAAYPHGYVLKLVDTKKGV
jgi:hypothetical protein